MKDERIIQSLQILIESVLIIFIVHLLPFYSLSHQHFSELHGPEEILYQTVFGVFIVSSSFSLMARKHNGGSSKMFLALSTARTLVFSTASFHFISIILGGAWFSNFLETLTWAFFMAILSFYRVELVHSGKGSDLLKGTSKNPSVRGIQWSAIGATIGSWFGAVLLPLDWGEPWQKWPIPLVMGAEVGLFTGALANCCFKVNCFLSDEREDKIIHNPNIEQTGQQRT